MKKEHLTEKVLLLLLALHFMSLLSCEVEKEADKVEPEPLELTSWAPIGAKWYFSGRCPGTTGPESCVSYYTIKSVRDTVVQDQASRILQIKHHEEDKTTLLSEEIMTGTTKKVYHYNKEEEEFYLLYDLTKDVGDTIVIDSELFIPNWGKSQNYQFRSRIDNTSTIYIFGNDLVAQRVKPICEEGEDYCWTYSSWGAPATVIEGIGSTYWMFGGNYENILVSPGHIGLRCFEYKGQVFKYDDFPLECDYK